MMIPRPNRKRGMPRIPAAWFGIMPGQRLAFWVRVLMRIKRRGVRKKDIAASKKLALDVRRVQAGEYKSI